MAELVVGLVLVVDLVVVAVVSTSLRVVLLGFHLGAWVTLLVVVVADALMFIA